MILLEDVTVVFGRTRALTAVSVELEAGINGVFGPNGSGKSTLLRIIAGLIRPTAGSVGVEGLPPPGTEPFRAAVGYVGHDSGLYPRLSVAENVGLFAKLCDAPAARVESLLDRLGLADRAKSPVGELSAGLKRRVAVARALVHDPAVLLLDEPYANVDDDAAEQISTCVQQWLRPRRIALIATHGAKRVKRFATAGLILKEGRTALYGRYGNRAERTTVS